MRKDIFRILIQCKKIGPIRYKVASLWNVSLMCPNFVPEFFEYWFYIDLPSRSMLSWSLAFNTLMSYIWNDRNPIKFRQEAFNDYRNVPLSLCMVGEESFRGFCAYLCQH